MNFFVQKLPVLKISSRFGSKPLQVFLDPLSAKSNGAREFPRRYSHSKKWKIRYFSMAEDGDGFLRRVSKDGFYFDVQIVDSYWSANHKQV